MKHVKISGHVFWEIMVHLLFVIVIIICIVAGFPENLNKAEEVDIIVDQVDYVSKITLIDGTILNNEQ